MSWPPKSDSPLRSPLHRNHPPLRTMEFDYKRDTNSGLTYTVQRNSLDEDWQPTPLRDILDEIHNPDPEPDYMQFYQPLGALLGETEPNKLPTQDWEFDLINHQVAGNLEQPAYKNLTPEIIQLAAVKGAPAQPAAKAPTASLAQAAQQMQQNQHSQQAGPATTPAPTQAPRPPFKSSPAGNTDTPQGDENAQQPSPRPPFKANPQAGTDQANPPQSIAAEAVDDYLANKANSNQTGGRAAASNPPQTGQIQIPQRFQPLIKAAGIDVDQNFRDAQNMGIFEWAGNVQSGGNWDFKNNSNLSGFDAKLRDDFGNWHFGVVAKGNGHNLETSMLGAGGYQVFFQDGGNPVDLWNGVVHWSRTFGGEAEDQQNIENSTLNGNTWGDNPGDAINIMEGWKDADKAF